MAAPATPHRVLPWRFGLFLALTASMVPLALVLPWAKAVLLGFDLAALTFLLTLPPLLRADVATMRQHSADNDANRAFILLIAVAVSLVVLVAVGSEIADKANMHALDILVVIATLLAAWVFSNTIFTLHYAHLYYIAGTGDQRGKDCGGADFPDTPEPVYWDFVYFAFTLGMTFQTSDVAVTGVGWRKVAILHCFAAFIYNLGIIAFTINFISGAG